ncbi:MAG: MBOAT family protein [Bacteroidales bacterium]|nr:MBOAT family protein [Bacteroidales bacterium]
MLFQSIEFLIFLPVVFILYWFVFKKLKIQNALVLVASYIFYGWWDWRFLILIAITSGFSYWSGLLIKSNERKPKAQKWICAGNITINLLILCVFKYFNFFSENFAKLFGLFGLELDFVTLNVILPVGISFYTFQALSYTIDVYRRKIEPTKDAVAFFAFISFFPQLVAGPIERATNLLPQFLNPRKFDYATAVDGCRQMLWGFFKKVVVADNCAVYVNYVFENYQSECGSTLLLAAILFTFQIYGDFSGYSDIAIGCAKLFGVRLMRNFNVPYFSRDIAEFWRRWHISLTTWFRDYIYIPLGGSRVSKAKVVRNTFIIFLVSGFWHGANWTFIAWGAYHALLFLPLILLGKNRKNTNIVAEGRLLPSFGEFSRMLLTFALVVIGWIIFRAESIGQAWEYVCGMMQFGTLKAVYRFFLPNRLLCWPTNLLIIIMLVVEWLQRDKQHGMSFSNKYILLRWLCYLIISMCIYYNYLSGNAGEFIYFQF